MLDAVEWCRWRFLRATAWEAANVYSALTAHASDLLDFRVPTGFGIGSVRVYSPSFRKILGISPPFQGQFAVVYSSVPLVPAAAAPVSGGTETDVGATPVAVSVTNGSGGSWLSQWARGLDAGPPTTTAAPAPGQRFLLSQRLCEGARLESLYIHRWTQRWQTVLSGVAYPTASQPSSTSLVVQYNRPAGSVELHLSTRDGLIGVRTLWSHSFSATSRSSLGLEVYGLTSTAGGGVSLGLRHVELDASASGSVATDPMAAAGAETSLLAPASTSLVQVPAPRSVTTAVVSPILGHTSLAYCTPVRPGVWVGARYDVNLYSYESNLAVGFSLQQDERLLKVRASLKEGASAAPRRVQGVGVSLQGRFGSAIVDVGFLSFWDGRGRSSVGAQLTFV